MAEKESPKTKREKTIDLSEWQKKNQAYLERRAKEKAEKEAAEAKRKAESQAKIEALKEAAKKRHSKTEQAGQETAKPEQDNSEDVQPDLVEQEQTSAPFSASEQTSADLTEADQKKTSQADSAKEKRTVDQESGGREVKSRTAQEAKKAEKKSSEVSERALAVSKTAKPSKLSKAGKKRWTSLIKALPLLIAGILAMLVSLYFLSPWSRLKEVKVTGNTQLSADEILSHTGISKDDYTLTTFLHQAAYAKQVKGELIWIKSAALTYHFPVSFDLAVEEYQVVGYAKDGADYYPVLSSGEVVDKPVTEAEVPFPVLIFQVKDLEMIKSFVLDLEELDSALMARIEDVKLSPTAATSDLLNLTMRDGHTVLVPLSGLKKKMAYYDRITSELTVSSIIDMEAGIYSYAK